MFFPTSICQVFCKKLDNSCQWILKGRLLARRRAPLTLGLDRGVEFVADLRP